MVIGDTLMQLVLANVSVVISKQIQMTSLREDLNFLIFSTATSPEFITALKKEFPPSKVQHLVDSRSDMNLSVREQQRINAERYHSVFQLSRKSSLPETTFRFADLVASTYGLILNTSAFLVSIELLGDEQQVKYWRDQVVEGKSLGAYGQTELGHGSNVKQLETVATYHPQTQTFTITSPSTSSAKFWPGVLGQYCTHSVIQARTIVGGKDIGVQTFVIEIRDSKLQPVKGVEAFDIGPKLGFDRIDNGGLYFRELTIPREALLSRYVKVTPEGKVEGLENKQAIKYGYGSMLNLRVKLTYNFAIAGIVNPARALHSIFTVQGTSSNPANRKLITDFVCVGLGMVIANKHPHALFDDLLRQIAAKDYVKADKLLVSCHIISSTFKALSSRFCVDLCSIMQTLTPLGKFRTSLIPFFLFNYIPAATYEGDNTVLLQQTSKYLLFKYNLDKQRPPAPKVFQGDDIPSAALALEHVLVDRLRKVKSGIQALGEKGVGFQTIWNEHEQNSLIEASVLWGYLTFMQSMNAILPQITKHQSFYAKICKGFTSFLTAKIGAFAECGYTVQPVESWKSFTEEEFNAMVESGRPIDVKMQPMTLYPRKEQWFSAKL